MHIMRVGRRASCKDSNDARTDEMRANTSAPWLQTAGPSAKEDRPMMRKMIDAMWRDNDRTEAAENGSRSTHQHKCATALTLL